MNYDQFLEEKRQLAGDFGFDPISLPDAMFDFQRDLTSWAIRKGRAAIFADCGLGKTLMQLAWADNVTRHTGRRVLILTPLAVAAQTVAEAHKFGMDAARSRDGELDSMIVVTNYDRLHNFNPDDFAGVVCDESSILKHYTGATQKQVTRFMSKMKFRLLCTATAAPNDFIELGTSSEALGELTYSEMLKRFFRQLDDKGQKKEMKQQEFAEKVQETYQEWKERKDQEDYEQLKEKFENPKSYYQKLSFRVSQTIGQWRLKHHARRDFWRWVASWARACRKPSDIGHLDDGYQLPPLIENIHIVNAKKPREGMLFTMPAFGLSEEREERKHTLEERCRMVAALVNHDRPAVVWCHTNPEGDLLEKIIPGARQVAGRTPNDEKEEIYKDFASGKCRVVVIKPKIGAWGLNWQHCNHVVTFASHSYEQYYQSVRRCWRFGQESPVTVDVIASEGESRVLANMQRKAFQADEMFSMLVQEMNNALEIKAQKENTNKPTIPKWLSSNKH